VKKLDEAIDKFFGGTKKITLKTLFEEVEKTLDFFDLQGLNEANQDSPQANKLAQETKANIMSLLPKFEISEAWGQKDTQARAEFEKYMNNITGTLSEKLAYIREFVNQSGERAGEYETSEILSNLMFLDLLSTVVNNFSPSGAGFLFEAFMAGLLKGTQAVEKVEGVLQIEDFLDVDNKPFSLKLLVPGTNVKGSTRNLISFLANHSKGAEGIEYLTVYKFGPEGKTKVLSFYSFTIDHENIYYWLSDTFKMENKKIYDIELAIDQAPGKEGAPARRIGGESPEEVESANAAQREAVAKVRKSYGYRLQKRNPDSFRSQMKSDEGMVGAELLKFHGIKTGILAKGKYGRVFDLTEEEIDDLPVSYDVLAADYGMSKDEYTSYSRTVRRLLAGSNLKGEAARAKADEWRAIEAAAASGENEEEVARWNEMAKTASEIRALDYTLFDVAEYRKNTYEKIRAIVSPAHPLGTALQPVRFAGDEEAVKGIEKSIEDMKRLYVDDPKAWEHEMLIKANLIPRAEKAPQQPPIFEAKKKKDDDDEKEDIKTQFNISSTLIVSRTLPSQYKKVRYGDIKVDRESIVEVGNIYAKQLEASVIPILEQLANLIAGITGYFAGDPEDRGQAGSSANDAIAALTKIFTEQKIEQ